MAPRAIKAGSSKLWLPERSLEKHCLDHFERFCFSLQLPGGLGPFRLEDYELTMLEDYFAGIVENLWLLPTGQRKSMLLGSLGLHCATYVREDSRIFILGGLGGHGRNALDAAAGFVERSPDLNRLWEAQEYGLGRLKSTFDRSRILVVSAGRRAGGRGGSTVEGESPDLILVEELHRHEDDGAALATLQSKAQKKSHGGWIVPTVIVTTAGDNLESALGRRLARATDVEAGAVVTADRRGEYYRRGIDADGDLVVHEWALPDEVVMPAKPDSSPKDQERYRRELGVYLAEVKKANPASFIKIDNLRRSLKTLSSEPWTFQRQHGNQWVVQAHPAIDRVGWAAGAREDLAIPRGAEGVVIGLDASDSWDTTALVPAWRNEDGRVVTAGARILQPSGVSRPKRMSDAIGILESMIERWPGAIVAFDRHYGGGYVAEVLEERHAISTVDVGMGAPFEQASMLLAELVDQQQVRHANEPELTSHVLAAASRASRFGRRWRLTQPPDGRPMDGAAALAMAVWIVFNPPVDERRVAPGIDLWESS
jgi:hypothetical protein